LIPVNIAKGFLRRIIDL